MIPIQFKILFFITLLIGAFAFGVEYEKGRNALEEEKIVEEKISNHNNDIEEISENEKVMEKIRVEYKEKIVYLPSIPVDADCPIDQSTKLRNEAYGSLPDLYFESAD